ncbi:hypothetical protein [Actinomadura rugatobispora]|uniref:D-apionate lactonase C-terminal domain-containing protein n=1 Tax=Actinomadura rugatobispora TaxID=1994 RepID=A0ABW1A8F9_9ACTN|nr:hypothetical protein GCM10010200_084150 [Actinomadura rugatobispora]
MRLDLRGRGFRQAQRLVELGIDLVGIAEFMDYPTMIPGVTLVDWETGAPNARYRALDPLMRHFGAGDTMVSTGTGVPGIPDPRLHAQAFITKAGTPKPLIVNKTGKTVTVALEQTNEPTGVTDELRIEQVSARTGAGRAVSTTVNEGHIVLDPYATAVLSPM